MMQTNQKPPKSPSKLKRLYSKIKYFCLVNGIPLIFIPLVIATLVCLFFLVAGSSVLGWDVIGFFRSPTGYLIIGVLSVGLLYTLYKIVLNIFR